MKWRALDYSLLYKKIVFFFMLTVYIWGKKSALAKNYFSREVIRKYVTSVLRACFLQMAAYT